MHKIFDYKAVKPFLFILVCALICSIVIPNTCVNAATYKITPGLEEEFAQKSAESKAKYGDNIITYNCTIYFDANSGSGEMGSIFEIISSGSKYRDPLKLPLCKFNAPFLHKFDKWNVNGELLNEGDEINETILKGHAKESFTDYYMVELYAQPVWVLNYDIIIVFCLIFLVGLIIIGVLIFSIYKFKNKVSIKLNDNDEKKHEDELIKNEELEFDQTIIKYKNLLDKNIITQEEYNKKKKELLNL